MAERYYLTLSRTLPEEKRDVRGKLRHAGTWRDGKKAAPQSGEWATGSVELTPSEVEKVEAASNVLRVEKIPPKDPPCVDRFVPSEADLQAHKMDMLHEWGFTGQGIDVGVIETGIGAGLLSLFNVKATTALVGTNLGDDPEHGSKVASVAVPRGARLVFSSANNQLAGGGIGSIVDDIYWMVDEVGVHVINMSYGSFRDPWQPECDAIAHAISSGVTVFASAGNDNRDGRGFYPASCAGVASVGALNRAAGWKKASFSNYGPSVDLWMQGVNVACYGPNAGLTSADGTSLSSPLAAYVHASLLTKGLTSIGQIGTQDAVSKGRDSVPSGLGGGGRVNGENAAFAMREFCV